MSVTVPSRQQLGRFFRAARCLCCAALLFGFTASAGAEVPGTAYIFPAGGQPGQKTPVRIGGYYLHEGAPFSIAGPGVAASPRITRTGKIWFEGPLIHQPASQQKEDYPADYLGEISVDPAASPGVRRWWVHTSQGVTPSLPFVVGRWPEVVEQETDGEPLPVPVTLPVTVNGRIFPRQDIDAWTFEVPANQVVTCTVLGARIGSPLISRLEIQDPQGKSLAEDLGSLGGDAFVQFTAPVAGRYTVRIHDAEFSGLQHYVYRLLITAGPFVNQVFPLGGRPGETLEMELAGANLPAAKATIPLPDKPGTVFWWHPPGMAAGELGIPLEVTKNPAVPESEPNSTIEQPQVVSLAEETGLMINGRIGAPGDVDVLAIDAKAGKPLQVEVRAAALGSLLDSVLTVFDAKGQQLAQSDDAGNLPDSSLTFTPPTDGRYFIALKHRIAQRGGPEYAYRLHLTPGGEQPAVPFSLRVPTDAINVDRNGQATLRVDAQRFGFNEPIELRCENLPAGVTVTGNQLGQGANQANLTFKAEAAAKPGLSNLRILGVGKKMDQEFQATAIITPQPGEEPRESLQLSVNVPTPFKIYGRFESKFSPRGSVYVRHYFIDRKGFEGPLEISLADRQNRHLQGTYGPVITVPAGATEFDYPLTLPPRMELGRTSRTCLMAVGVVTLEDGSQAKVAYSSQEQSDQIIVLTGPERMQLQLARENLILEPGATVEVGVRVDREDKLTKPTKIELICPPHMPIVAADGTELPATAADGKLVLKIRSGSLGTINMPVTIRATTLDERGYPVVAEALLELVPASGKNSP